MRERRPKVSISEARKRSLAHLVKRLEAYEDVQRTMGRWMVAVNFRQADKALAEFAMKQADVWLEWADEGVFSGPDAVTSAMRTYVAPKPGVGELDDYQLCMPIVEVAKDLQTAKATWGIAGIGAIPQRRDQSNLAGAPQAIWHFDKVAVDMLNVDRKWKIWHLHWFRFINCSYEKGWVNDLTMINRLNTSMHPLSRPTTYHNPYTPVSIRDGIPPAPRPYETWTDSSWMLDRDTTR